MIYTTYRYYNRAQATFSWKARTEGPGGLYRWSAGLYPWPALVHRWFALVHRWFALVHRWFALLYRWSVGLYRVPHLAISWKRKPEKLWTKHHGERNNVEQSKHGQFLGKQRAPSLAASLRA